MDDDYSSDCESESIDPVIKRQQLPSQQQTNLSSSRLLPNSLARESSFQSTNSHLLNSIWSEIWQPTQLSTESYSPGNLCHEIFDKAASPDDSPAFLIEGANISELAIELRNVLILCIDENDFTRVLSRDRTFLM